ncbi:MAG: hypothetical protein PHE17_05345 [Thiothrix sp.]|uniref:hypothetical protein n=1 Tax=Thiothrix sp. TaxID=1032 RepID=UPI00260754CF|nr:hypothetical protein [Thiothrix sp.]MDD5392427.1 hypothetical protein [Thiothrix sp.]
MNELEKALMMVAGTEKVRGYRTRAARNMAVSPCTVTSWFSRGFGAACAVKVWNATGRKADLVRLIEEGEAMERVA